MIPQDAFESLLALADRLPRPIAQVFEDAREDGRASSGSNTRSDTERADDPGDALVGYVEQTDRRVTGRGHRNGPHPAQEVFYRKLGASGRLEALAIANRFQLLDGNREDEEPG